jgi:hypothetical protein
VGLLVYIVHSMTSFFLQFVDIFGMAEEEYFLIEVLLLFNGKSHINFLFGTLVGSDEDGIGE